jgi:uncharacterized protein
MKRLITVFLALMLCAMLTISVSAAQMPRLVDGADLLTDSEEADLLARLDEASEYLQADIVIITLESCGGYSADQVINAFYDQNDFGYGINRDGVMLLLSMAERDYRILCNGFAATAITPSERDDIGAYIVDDLSAGAYYDAFGEFLEECKWEIDGERSGYPFAFGRNLGVSLMIGVITALLITGVLRSQLKSVQTRTGAREYAKPGSMKMTQSSDLYLYRTVNRIRKPQESSSSSGGFRSGGGGGRHVGGGKF